LVQEYIHEGWFIFDVISIIPIDYIFWGAGLSQEASSLARLLRLVKIVRIY